MALTRWRIPYADLMLDGSTTLVIRARQILTILLLSCALTMGGNGSLLLDLGVELLSVLLLFILLFTPAEFPRFALSGKIVLLLALALPLVQLVPIPLSIWRALPGRQVAWLIQQASGTTAGYHSISLNPDATRQALVRLLPGTAMFLAALRAAQQERHVLVVIAISLILVSAAMGAIQFSTDTLYPYPTPHEGSAVGIFVNRNHFSDFLMAGMFLIAAAGRVRASSRGMLSLIVAVVLMLALCVVCTTSKMGNGLMPFAVFASISILLGRHDSRILWWLGVAGALATISLVLVSQNSVVQATFGRFATAGDDARWDIWSTSAVAIRQFWPIGSGLGTFVPIYASVENLDTVMPSYVNHAHDEYLELALEGGAAAIAVMLAYIATVAMQIRHIVGARDWPTRAAGLGIILVLAAHSLVDYPLRTIALSTLFALANALLFGDIHRETRQRADDVLQASALTQTTT